MPDAPAALTRLARDPSVHILVINGADELVRARVLAAAREQNAWCVHLRATGAPTDLRSVQRAELMAALPLDADHATNAQTIRAVIAARRARSAG